MNWAKEELEGLSLGDTRRNHRVLKLIERLDSAPSASIPEACKGYAEIKGAYRLLSQEAIAWEKLMEPHWEKTAQRMSAHQIVLCLQDTTEVDFNGQDIEGFGPLSYE